MGNSIYAIVLAGGRGERFWPQSRAAMPKQLQALTGGRTMIEETLARVAPLVPPERQWIVTSDDLTKAVRSVIGEGPQVIGEPMGRNTAPAIAMAAAEVLRQDPEGVMVILPSDHHIADVERFRAVLERGVALARQDFLVTIGIKPERPETGYGYIERGESLEDAGEGCYSVKNFREKPDEETARRFLQIGSFYWNGGIFVWRASAILDNIRNHLPSLYQATMRWQERGGLRAGPGEFLAYFQQVEKISIDYGVMEKAGRVAVVEGQFGWDDLGSWEAVGRYYAADEDGNRSAGPLLALGSADNVVVADQGLVAAVGVRDLIIVRSGNAVLVCHRSKAQEVRRVVEELRRREDGTRYL